MSTALSSDSMRLENGCFLGPGPSTITAGLTEEIRQSPLGLGGDTSCLIFTSAFQQPFSQVQPKQVGTSHRSFLPTSLASPSQSLFPSRSLLSDLQSQSPWRPTSVFSLKYWCSTKGDFSPQRPIGIVSRHFQLRDKVGGGQGGRCANGV